MKKRILAILLSAALLLPALALPGSAAEGEAAGAASFSLITYNVQGLTRLGGLPTDKNCAAIGALINDYDFAGVQEDFNFDYALRGNVTLPYQTYTSGITPIGDGLNYFSRFPLYNVERFPWDEAHGVLDDGSDELTPKGILYATVEIAPGVYIDVYNAHTDAYEDAESLAARRSNLSQLAALINERSAGRAVIVMGDLNARFSRESDRLYELLVEPCGLTDAWVEIENNGVYPTKDSGLSFNDWWEKWDSVDHVMYRDGGGVDLEALSHEYIFYLNPETGASYSDHAASAVTMQYTVIGDLAVPEQLETERFHLAERFWNGIVRFAKALFLLLDAVIQQGISG